jgi:V/A-type H+/Na+-transporting ATPase subunit A
MTGNGRQTGRITRIAGPVVEARGLQNVRLFDVVRVGRLGLIGEIIRLTGLTALAGPAARDGSVTTIQVYEDTAGIRIGEPVAATGMPLVAHLGPGLLGSVYDGLQRPLAALAEHSGAFIQRGVAASPLPAATLWSFTPTVAVGELVGPGDVLGTVPETRSIEHRIMVPPGLEGRVVKIAHGELRVDEIVAVLEPLGNHGGERCEIPLAQRWPVRQPRPVRARLDPARAADHRYAHHRHALPGSQRRLGDHSRRLRDGQDRDRTQPGPLGRCRRRRLRGLRRAWQRDDRGAGGIPQLVDPRTGEPLMQRTVLIANTSNMPVAAREASIYTGITIAEYYRDMGYDVLLLADSTSRWGEALREISGRLEEMPGEEGYPAYLARGWPSSTSAPVE